MTQRMGGTPIGSVDSWEVIFLGVLIVFFAFLLILSLPSVYRWIAERYSRLSFARRQWPGNRGLLRIMKPSPTLEEDDLINRERYAELQALKTEIGQLVYKTKTFDSRLSSLENSFARIKASLSALEGRVEPGQILRPSQDFQVSGELSKSRPTGMVPSRLTVPSSGVARAAYQKLLAGGLRASPVDPVFAILDVKSSGPTRAVGRVKYLFRRSDSKQSAFVVFPKEDSKEAFLFPNPTISFTEAMKYIFPNLSHANFEVARSAIKPVEVKLISDDTWEMLVD